MSTLLCLEPKFRAWTCKTVLVLDEEISLHFLRYTIQEMNGPNSQVQHGIGTLKKPLASASEHANGP